MKRKNILIDINKLLMKKRDKNNMQYVCGYILRDEWIDFNNEITKVLNDTRTLLK